MTTDLQGSKLQSAFGLHQRGELAQAREMYKAILTGNSRHYDALQLLGVLELQLGNARDAVDLLSSAIEIQPGALSPWSNRGRACEQLGRLPEALSDYRRASELAPGDAALHFRQGVLHRRCGEHEAAVGCYDRALSIDPAFPRACFNRGNALVALGRMNEAVASYQRAAAQEPHAADIVFNLGTALLALKQATEAVAAFDRALALQPGSIDALVNKGNALRDLGRTDEAVAAYDSAIALDPARSEAFNNKASALLTLGRREEAIACYDRALVHHPQVASLHTGRANALRQTGDIEEAIAAFDRALALAPADVDARTGRSLCLLLNGDLQRGFAEYEWRWRSEDLAASEPRYRQPRWLGQEPLDGKRLLVRWEQGLGDTIQFCRYAKWLSGQGARVILVVQPPLLRLLQRLDGEGELIAEGSPLPDFDYYCPMLSLPLACRTDLASIPHAKRYLGVDPAKRQHWERRLGTQTAPRIGIAWSGRPEHKNDANRSMPLAQLLDALPPGLELYSLQKDVRPGDMDTLRARPEIRHFGNELADFSDTAALCDAMDLVISVDTSIAHLAGALGKPLWLMLPKVPDWRWLMHRSDTPWYPTARLYRQHAVGDWSAVLGSVTRGLSQLLVRGFGMALADGAASDA